MKKTQEEEKTMEKQEMNLMKYANFHEFIKNTRNHGEIFQQETKLPGIKSIHVEC